MKRISMSFDKRRMYKRQLTFLEIFLKFNNSQNWNSFPYLTCSPVWGFYLCAYGTRLMLVLESETLRNHLDWITIVPSPHNSHIQFNTKCHSDSNFANLFHLSIHFTTTVTICSCHHHSLLGFSSNHSLLTTILDSLWSSLHTRIIFLKWSLSINLLALNVQDRECVFIHLRYSATATLKEWEKDLPGPGQDDELHTGWVWRCLWDTQSSPPGPGSQVWHLLHYFRTNRSRAFMVNRLRLFLDNHELS